MLLEVFFVALTLDGSIAPSPREGHLHWLAKELKALRLIYGGGGGLGVLENDESLTLSLEVCLGDDVNNRAELGEDLAQGLAEGIDLDALLKVADVDAAIAKG